MKTVPVVEQYTFDSMGQFEIIDYEVFSSMDAALCAYPTVILKESYPNDIALGAAMEFELRRGNACRVLVAKPVTA
ncbi:MAG: hypothetical protein CMF22_12100 [Idiomarinaceae bacterium]|nr:hypothetical protein [Idiomarinaceae bacterium]|tara:strand:+ start:3771 stop:3998 length:228 start_codon:yes stop_codon:yes gene_type:complete